jgi:hypothetical protein
MVIRFYRTTLKQQKIIGTIKMTNNDIKTSGDVEVYLSTLLHGIDRSNSNAVKKALEVAPTRYNGVYVRAEII